jgi:hypothetical protein
VADPIVFYNGYLALTTSTGSSTYTVPVGLKSATIPMSRAELDDAAMGDDISATYPGIMSAPVSTKYRQNFAAGGIDALAFTRWNAKTAFRLKVRAVNSAVAVGNPSYIWNRIYISAITPVQGAHGEILYNQVEFRPMTGGTLTRSTST